MQNRLQPAKGILFFGLGVAAGWIVKQLFDSPEATQKRQKVWSKLQDLQERLADTDEAQRVEKIFGQVSDEATRIYQTVKEDLIRELSILQVAVEDIDKQKYLSIVEDIVEDLKVDNDLSDAQLDRLTQALSDDFSKIKRRRSRLKRLVKS